MANIYNLIKHYTTLDNVSDSSLEEFGSKIEEGGYKIDESPYWCLTVFSFKTQITFSREKGTSINALSGSSIEIDRKIIITSDCIGLTIDKSKSNYLKSFSAILKQSDINYLTEILPDDWIMVHIVPSKQKLDELIEKIKKEEQVNKFEDGFKFLGRIGSIEKLVSISPGIPPQKNIQIAISATGFKELATSIFYDPQLSEHDLESNNIGTWLAKLGLRIQDLFGQLNKQDRQDDNVHKIIPTLVDLIVGKGINLNKFSPAAIQSGGQLQNVFGGGASSSVEEAPYAYLIPKEVGLMLGRDTSDPEQNASPFKNDLMSPSKSSGITSYADILEMIYGVQNYESKTDSIEVFNPILKDGDSKAARRFTGLPLLGSAVPFMPSFVNVPLWSILQNYLNAPINEIYTCWRVNPSGNVMPTIVLRQNPFSTDIMDKIVKDNNKSTPLAGRNTSDGFIQTFHETVDVIGNNGQQNIYKNVNITRFLELPRWKFHPAMIHSVRIRRSGATRCNFLILDGVDSMLKKNNTIPEQRALNKPVRDDLDIQRNGLLPYTKTLNVGISSTIGRTPTAWMNIIADIMFASQLTFTGTIESVGIYLPICEGDNLEFDNIVFHIEKVTDRCSISSNGMKHFVTEFTLTNGVEARDSQKNSEEIYPGVKSTDKENARHSEINSSSTAYNDDDNDNIKDK